MTTQSILRLPKLRLFCSPRSGNTDRAIELSGVTPLKISKHGRALDYHDAHNRRQVYSRMREEVNDQCSQESSELWKWRPTTVARSPNQRRNRTELASRH